jgi:signal transduction histidine kinase
LDLVLNSQDENKYVKILIIIEDNGAGISKENLGKLFSDFTRLQEHSKMNAKGTGLGMSICKKIITQMGGQVVAESEVG